VRPIVETATETKTEAEQKKKVATYYTRTPEQMAQAVQGTTPVAVTYAPAPVVPPEGYEVAKVETVVTGPKPPMTVQQALHPSPVEQVTVTTFKAKEPEEVATSLFGPKVSYYDPATGKITEELVTRKGELIYVTRKQATAAEVLSGRAVPSPQEQQAILGLSLASTAATGVAVPKIGAFAVGGVTVAEVGKFAVTREHLTVPEAIGAAGMGELVGVGFMAGTKFLQPRVQKSLEASYRQAVEQAQLWKPSAAQKIAMKVTGVKAPRLAQEIVGGGEPRPVSFEMIQKGFAAPEEAYFWDYPTPKSAQVYLRQPQAKVKSWAVGTLVKRVYLEGLFTTTIQTGYITELEKPVKPSMPYIPKEPYITQAAAKPVLLPLSFAGLGVSVTPSITRVDKLVSATTPLLRVEPTTRLKARQLTRLFTRQTPAQMQRQVSSLSQVMGAEQTLTQAEKQVQQQAQVLHATQTQKQTQLQREVQKQMLGASTPTFTIPKAKGLPYYPLGGGEPDAQGFRRFFGKWFPRKHKVKTWEQQLRTFGLKAPKSLREFGKAERFADLVGTTKKRGENVKITKMLSFFGKTYNYRKPKKSRKKRRQRRR